MTITARVVDCVKRYPARTAWGIAKELHEKSGTVSSILLRLVKRKTLRRAKGYRGSWIYYTRKFGHDC